MIHSITKTNLVLRKVCSESVTQTSPKPVKTSLEIKLSLSSVINQPSNKSNPQYTTCMYVCMNVHTLL